MILKELIDAAEVGRDVDISDSTPYTEVRFYHEEGEGFSYRIIAKRNMRFIYATKRYSDWESKFWKTLNGAKRDFLRNYGKRSAA